ncbi:hypothetical protein [Piscibacillus halophilus]|nr:hypothetical protein [Piscibacillus halophilus]
MIKYATLDLINAYVLASLSVADKDYYIKVTRNMSTIHGKII